MAFIPTEKYTSIITSQSAGNKTLTFTGITLGVDKYLIMFFGDASDFSVAQLDGDNADGTPGLQEVTSVGESVFAGVWTVTSSLSSVDFVVTGLSDVRGGRLIIYDIPNYASIGFATAGGGQTSGTSADLDIAVTVDDAIFTAISTSNNDDNPFTHVGITEQYEDDVRSNEWGAFGFSSEVTTTETRSVDITWTSSVQYSAQSVRVTGPEQDTCPPTGLSLRPSLRL